CAPASNTHRPLARDQAAPVSTLALAKAASLGCERVRPLAWCSRPRDSAASLAGALMDIVLRAFVAYVFILFLMRVVGRRELSSMEPSDVILLVVIGDLLQNGVTQSDDSVTGIVLAAGTIGLLATGTAFVTYRSRRIRSVIE